MEVRLRPRLVPARIYSRDARASEATRGNDRVPAAEAGGADTPFDGGDILHGGNAKEATAAPCSYRDNPRVYNEPQSVAVLVVPQGSDSSFHGRDGPALVDAWVLSVCTWETTGVFEAGEI